MSEHCESATVSQIVRTDDDVEGLSGAVQDVDLAVVGTLARSRFGRFVFSNRTTELLEALPCSVLLVRPRRPRQNTPLRRLVERYLF